MRGVDIERQIDSIQAKLLERRVPQSGTFGIVRRRIADDAGQRAAPAAPSSEFKRYFCSPAITSKDAIARIR